MSLDFFTSQQGLKIGLGDLTSNIGTNNNAPVKKNTYESFKTDKSNSQYANDREKFSDFMDSLKKKKNAQQDDRSTKKTQGEEKTQRPSELSQFQTQRTALSFAVSDTESSDGSVSDAPLQVLSQALQELIDEEVGIIQENSETEKVNESSALIQTLGSGEEITEEDNALHALLSTIITKILSVPAEGDEENVTLDTTLVETPDPGALTTLLGGLSPQGITELKEQIHIYLTGDLSEEEQDELLAFISQFYPLTQPENNRNGKSSVAVAATISENVLKTDLQQVGNTGQQQNQPEHHTQSRYDSRYDARYEGTLQKQVNGEPQTFETTLKNVDGKTTGTPPALSNDNTQNTSGQRFLLANNNALTTLSALDGTIAQNGISVSGTASPLQTALTNLTTQAQSATHNHPATQLVSMTIQKAVKAGEDTNIKLRLDPPDLGRVEVKMSIDKDNATKIVLTAEKPETFMMLQRDSEALQRALVDSGLNAEGDLSFELASEEHEFNQNNKGDHSGSGHNTSDEEEQITSSTMDWHVDPETGRMHYNIVV